MASRLLQQKIFDGSTRMKTAMSSSTSTSTSTSGFTLHSFSPFSLSLVMKQRKCIANPQAAASFLLILCVQALYACQISYIVAIGMTKLSIAFFIARLTRYGPQIRLAYILATISSAWIVISVLITALRGNISKPWETLDGSRALVRYTASKLCRTTLV